MSVPVPAEPATPAEAIQAAATVRLRQYDSEYNADHLTWRDFASEATEVLGAAAPAIRADERQRLANEVPSLIVNINGELDPAAIEQVKHNFHAAQAEHARYGKEASAAVALILAKAERIAGLEQLARDILRCHLEIIGTDQPDDIRQEIEQWEATLNGGRQ